MNAHSLRLAAPAESRSAAIEAEFALLGCALYAGAEALERAEAVKPEHFSEPTHGRLWATLLDLTAKGRAIDPVSVFSRLESDPGLKDLGGLRFLADLIDSAPPSSAAGDYAEIVIDRAMGRAVQVLASEAAGAVQGGAGAVPVIEAMERGLADLAQQGPQRTAFASVGDIIAQAVERAKLSKGLAGISTGITSIDAATGGLRPGTMIVLAGRPGMGKSTAGLVLAKNIARGPVNNHGEPIGPGLGTIFFSLEMPEHDLGLRVACDITHDPWAPFYNGRPDNPTYFEAAKNEISADHWRRLERASAQAATWPLAIDARPGLTVAQMLTAARRKFREWNKRGITPGAIVVDHLTIVRSEQDRQGNRVSEVSDISRGLAEMAKVLDVPVVALCQLSRDVEKRGTDMRPKLSDLRWSGEIEQDARLISFLYRPEYYIRRPENEHDDNAMAAWKEKLSAVRNKLFWLIEKNNNGPTGEVETYCSIACSAIRDKLGATL